MAYTDVVALVGVICNIDTSEDDVVIETSIVLVDVIILYIDIVFSESLIVPQ